METKQKNKFTSFKDMTRKDYGRSAITGLLGGEIIRNTNILIFEILGSIIAFLGLICGIVWLYRVIKKIK